MGADNSGVIYALWSYPTQAADERGGHGDHPAEARRCRLVSLPVPVYGNVSTLTNRSAAAAQREPIEEQDDLHYATIYTPCSENQVQSDQKEQVLYSLVNIKRPNAVPE
ncbi:hypothetical protein NHX12_008538 [Muraenolepis orangiensis]|uniref:Uncharacterized protein n=1 Tax=Muraenolepis orangiensis TaxID=630683 RepID=A0A9Q0DLJ1_9TELE|nr:hypothetical protein NHX12_008538 [Muraenolepis orangiensis]